MLGKPELVFQRTRTDSSFILQIFKEPELAVLQKFKELRNTHGFEL
jgi:hypothetical protein